MNNIIKEKLEQIFLILDMHIIQHPNHKESCIAIKNKFIELQNSLLNEVDSEANSSIEWSKLYAPRIIFEGINNKPLLEALEQLNEQL